MMSKGYLMIPWRMPVVLGLMHAAMAHASEGVNITYPNGGESFTVGQTITITWTIETDKVLSNIVLYFSPDKGVTRYEILTDKNIVSTNHDIYNGANGSVDWIIPDSLHDDFMGAMSTVSDECVVSALAPYEEYEYVDLSDAYFSVSQASESDGGNGGGCGAGSSAVLLPLIVLRASSSWRRRKRRL